MTTVLALDTSTRIASVALCDDERVLAEVSRATRGTDLLLLADEVCRAAGLPPSSIEAVAIGAGPGSFTGLRIGMATAKGIAYAARRPLWIVSSLAALALGAHEDGVVIAALDARRGELFAGGFRCSGRSVAPLGDERVIIPSELTAFAEATGSAEAVRFVGDAATAHPELAALPGQWSRTPQARDVAALALAGPRDNVLVAAVPTYVRRADAEIMYPDGVPGALRKR